jgi:hypothetical protein
MRFIIGFLSGVLGMLAGWVGLAALVIGIAGPDRDGGIAMGAFFNIGPIGAFFGFIAGVVLFIKLGLVRKSATPDAAQPAAAAVPAQRRVSSIFAGVILALTAGLGWWGWYEFIRSPYLTHGYMTLELQFRLPAGMALPPDKADVHIVMEEGQQQTSVLLGRMWHGTDGDRRAILASAELSMKTSRRVVRLEFPGDPEQTWRLDLPTDPDPTPGFSPWQYSNSAAAPKIEMHFRLGAER